MATCMLCTKKTHSLAPLATRFNPYFGCTDNLIAYNFAKELSLQCRGAREFTCFILQ